MDSVCSSRSASPLESLPPITGRSGSTSTGMPGGDTAGKW